jgi:membrane-bound lytic murein transglycosylase B
MKIRLILCFFLALFTTTSLLADQDMAKRDDVQAFIAHMEKDYDFSKAELEKLFTAVEARPQVIKSMKHPLETNPWGHYRSLFITQKKINDGVAFWNKYKDALAKAGKQFQMDPSVIVATIGVESNYGSNVGKFRVIDALSDISFNYPARSKFFTYELEQYLLMTRENNLDPLEVKGSYAGAIGMPQFMPDSFRNYAVDFSGKHHIDLTNNTVDVIGSIANYYHKKGWKEGHTIAAPAEKKTAKKDSEKVIPNNIHDFYNDQTLNEAGYSSEASMPQGETKAMILDLKSQDSEEYWLGYNNFAVIMKYNSSVLYAMVITQLSRKIQVAYEQQAN